jgi:hypothetical protein
MTQFVPGRTLRIRDGLTALIAAALRNGTPAEQLIVLLSGRGKM